MKINYQIFAIMGLLALWTNAMNTDSLGSKNLRVAFPSNSNIEKYEPTQIHFAYQYIFLESIYSPLIELSNDTGSPVASIAREYYWKGSELHMVIRDDLKTVDGYNIGIDDVVTSLKRLLILSRNTHGDFKSLLCPDVELTNLEQNCPSMVADGNTLILKLVAHRDFLIPMLASIDFAIIPRTSIDPQSLKIVDYRNTSGPYYVAKDNGKGHITLKANPQHFHFNNRMAPEITLVPTKGMSREQVVEHYNKGEYDHITTIEGIPIEAFKRIERKENRFHESIYIQTEIAYITEQGKKRLPLIKRLAFAKALQKSFHHHYKNKDGYKTIRQFFLPLGHQGLSPKEEYLLEQKFDSIPMEESGEGVSLGIFKSHPKILQKYHTISKTYMPNLRVERAKAIPAFSQLADKDIPDYIIVNTDSGFLEDIGLLSYTINAGYFGLFPREGKAWLEDYMNTPEKNERLKKLKTMHLKSLMEGLMLPLLSTPYLAVTRKPWHPELSALFANNPLWKIRKDK